MADADTGSRLLRAAQGPVFAVALLGAVTLIGTLGYMLIEGWSAWDAFYMVMITITTVGYGEVHQMSRAAGGMPFHGQGTVIMPQRGTVAFTQLKKKKNSRILPKNQMIPGT